MRWSPDISMQEPTAAKTALPPQSLEDAWAGYSILRLRFSFCSLGMKIPAFHAALWHGVIGARLRELDPIAYLAIWEKEQTAPYALRAQIGPTEIPEGERFGFDISLFGKATEYVGSVIAAVESASHALGQAVYQGQRGRAVLEDIHRVTPMGLLPVQLDSNEGAQELGIVGRSILEGTPQRAVPAIRLVLDVPLRLKDGGAFITEHPSFVQLLRRVLGRMRQLHPSNSAEQAKTLLQQARSIQSHGAVRWTTLQRWSARQQQSMAFGGLTGFLEYHGELQPFLPWLALGSWLHIGGKSTFGFGTYQLLTAE